jgi:hypothetical protein
MPAAPSIVAALAAVVGASAAGLSHSPATAASPATRPAVSMPPASHADQPTARDTGTASRAATPKAPAVDYRVSFDSRARRGGTAAITMQLQVDDRDVVSPATKIRIMAPAGIDITSSDLGMATCQLPQASITNVLAGSAAQTPCPRNSLLGHGTATAMLRFTPSERPILGRANVSLFSGDEVERNPGLMIFVAALNPVATGLAYTGYLFEAERPFGLGMQLLLPLIPSPPFGATVSLGKMRVTIGARDIVYSERRGGRTVRYRPQGLGLPTRCPKGGFPFRVQLEFANGSHRTVTTRVRCPPRI